MKVHGGQMTETGFIEDPGYAQELKLKQINAQITAHQRVIDSAATRAAKLAAAKEIERLKKEGWEYQRGTAMMTAGIVAGAAGASGPGKADFEGVDSKTGNEVVRDKRGAAWVRTGFDANGQPQYAPHQGSVIPKVQHEKNVTATTELAQAAASASTMLDKVKANPTAFGFGATAADWVPGIMGKSAVQTAVGMTPDAKALRVNFVRDAAMEMSRLYGAAQSQGEAHRAQGFLINPDKDDIELVMQKLQGARAYADDARSRWGQAANRAVAERTGLQPPAAPAAPGAAPAPAPAPAGAVVDFNSLPKSR
jgi:hypothetical protein